MPRATKRGHPSVSCADPPQKSSSSLVGGSAKKRRALSDASNVVVADNNSRPNRRANNGRVNNGRKNAPMESSSSRGVQREPEDALKGIEKRRAKVLDALLDELDGDCALLVYTISFR